MKIYTRTGDEGFTSLFGGTRISKDHIRIESYGTVDELNSFVGTLYDKMSNKEIREILYTIQNRLFDIGSSLACDPEKEFKLKDVDEDDIRLLEYEIDKMDEVLPPLRNFILPSGHSEVSAAHQCRTICRRAERRVVSLSQISEVNPLVIQYLNRLSDYFFVLARYIAHLNGISDMLWTKKEQ